MERQTTVISQEELNRQSAICHEIASYWNAQGRTPLAFVDTYGCQQNEADSERIRGMLRECGYRMSDTEEGADCIVINTCAIREHAETRVYGNVGALVHTKNRHPAQKIFLCGCMMGQPAVVDKIKHSYHHVDGVFNPHQLWRFPELLQSVLTKRKRIFAVDDSAGNIAEGIPVVRASNLKAWVSIMYGCNNFCTYCIVPYVRGRERSRRPEEIIEEVKGLVAAGYKDITVLGQNVNSYGKDLDGALALSDRVPAGWYSSEHYHLASGSSRCCDGTSLYRCGRSDRAGKGQRRHFRCEYLYRHRYASGIRAVWRACRRNRLHRELLRLRRADAPGYDRRMHDQGRQITK